MKTENGPASARVDALVGPVLVRKVSHYFEHMDESMRPQDESMDGIGLKFETFEHGGDYPDCFPNVIQVTDKAGRWCRYEPIEVGGTAVRSHGFFSVDVDREKSAKRDDEELRERYPRANDQSLQQSSL